ncbi:MAG: zeta toxin family protein [Acidimicrobiia bacterium]|nr:zeta toxin family protein [Acidimicrobiia bacterium]
MSRLDLVVGPNGAGKSTFVEFVLADARPGVPFVNADVIAAERWPDDPLSHGYDAAQAAEAVRDALLARGESFIAETVASHESKVDLVRRARDAGYYVHLVVVAVPEEYSVHRVHARVAVGGQDVPEEKIRSRWRRLWDNVVAMIELADSAEVVDNSGPGPVTIATFVAGDIVGAPRWSDWAPGALASRWSVTSDPG